MVNTVFVGAFMTLGLCVAVTFGQSPSSKRGYASVNGVEMYYEIHGTGTPLVLIHGGGSTIQTSFGRVLHSFATRHKVIAVELQAHDSILLAP